MLVPALLFFLTAVADGLESSVWPMPKSMQLGNGLGKLDNKFHFVTSSSSSNILNSAISRYEKLLAVPGAQQEGKIKACDLTFNTEEISNVVGSDESYQLNIDEMGHCKIVGETVWGILRGMETFTQLFIRDDKMSVETNFLPVSISDAPRYTHRGILIDTSRHYLPMSEIYRVIDGLVINKFNVLHWHAVDAQSFPLQTPSEPTMEDGAYSDKMVYSMRDVQDITFYAFERGVDVVMEIDVPGHAASWTKGNPEIMADCFEKYSYNINDFALNPTLNKTYEVVEGVFTDVLKNSAGFLNNLAETNTYKTRFHAGGDEVVYGCWAEDEQILNYMSENSISSYDQLLIQFITKAIEIVKNYDFNGKTIFWNEVFTAAQNSGVKLPQDEIIFQIWTDSAVVASVTAANYQVIVSPSNYWYLNYVGISWEDMYEYDPTMGLSSDTQKDLIIGGEGALWAESLDENNIELVMFPRASAIAERLWSDERVNDVDAAVDRLVIQKCRMVNRGLKVTPVQPADYCSTIYV